MSLIGLLVLCLLKMLSVHSYAVTTIPEGYIYFTYGDRRSSFSSVGMKIVYRPENPGPYTSTGYGSSATLKIYGQYKTKGAAREHESYQSPYEYKMEWNPYGLYYYLDDYYQEIKAGYWIEYAVRIDDFGGTPGKYYSDHNHLYHVPKKIKSCEIDWNNDGKKEFCSTKLKKRTSRVYSSLEVNPQTEGIVVGVLLPLVVLILIFSLMKCNKKCKLEYLPDTESSSEINVVRLQGASVDSQTSEAATAVTSSVTTQQSADQPSSANDIHAPPSYMTAILGASSGSIQPPLYTKGSQEQLPSYVSVMQASNKY